MNVHLSLRAIEHLAAAPLPIQKAFIKQITLAPSILDGTSAQVMRYRWVRLRRPLLRARRDWNTL
jgi:hypothetical protein